MVSARPRVHPVLAAWYEGESLCDRGRPTDSSDCPVRTCEPDVRDHQIKKALSTLICPRSSLSRLASRCHFQASRGQQFVMMPCKFSALIRSSSVELTWSRSLHAAPTRSRPFALLLCLLLAEQAVAEVREIWYNITYATANPDGQFERQVIGINGTWP